MSTSITDNTAPVDWTDSKKWLWLLGPLLPMLCLLSLLIGYFYDVHLLYWLSPVIGTVIVPVLDFIVGTNKNNPPEEAMEELEASQFYRFILYAFLPSQFAVTIFGVFVAVADSTSGLDYIGLVITLGMVNGLGVNTAHELGHKKVSLDKWLSKVALAPIVYGHFFVEHNRGHHKHVATPLDPASARLGEGFWAFVPRAVGGGIASAWNIEKTRLSRKNKGPWTFENDNIQGWAITVVLFGGLTIWLGWAALPFLLLQAIDGLLMLEMINYLEHYGLCRKFNEKTNRYERCQPEHSWNSDHTVTNLFFYQLQRHSDHHANPTRPYRTLRHFDEAPQLPTGYTGMFLLVYFPPLWFAVMDKRVKAYYNGDLSRANVLPSKRAKFEKEWGTPAA